MIVEPRFDEELNVGGVGLNSYGWKLGHGGMFILKSVGHDQFKVELQLLENFVHA